MWGFLSVVLLCATAIYLAHRAEMWYSRIRPSEPAVAAPVPAPWQPEPMPAVLMSLAAMESERWAQQAALDRMQELYNELRDWNAVAAHFRSEMSPR